MTLHLHPRCLKSWVALTSIVSQFCMKVSFWSVGSHIQLLHLLSFWRPTENLVHSRLTLCSSSKLSLSALALMSLQVTLIRQVAGNSCFSYVQQFRVRQGHDQNELIRIRKDASLPYSKFGSPTISVCFFNLFYIAVKLNFRQKMCRCGRTETG